MNEKERLLQDLLTCETMVWRALQTGDWRADQAALHPDFLGVYPSGFAGRAEHAGQLIEGPTIHNFHLEGARIIPLAADCALLAYKARYVRAKGDAEETMYVSSVWQRSGSGWLNLFSQDTPSQS